MYSMKLMSIVPPLVLFWACASKSKTYTATPTTHKATPITNPLDTVLAYKSANNGSADIKLTMLANHTFDFHLQTLPPTDAKAIKAKLIGTWKEEHEYKRLLFTNNKELLKELFDSATSTQNKQFFIVNDSIIDINDKVPTLFIGGILCEKKSNKP
jgi:hypothetical protein